MMSKTKARLAVLFSSFALSSCLYVEKYQPTAVVMIHEPNLNRLRMGFLCNDGFNAPRCARYSCSRLRGGSKNVEPAHTVNSVHDAFKKWKPAVQIIWSVLVCLFGVQAVGMLMYLYFFIAARFLDLFSGHETGRLQGQVSPHIIAAFALLGSVVGSAGGQASHRPRVVARLRS